MPKITESIAAAIRTLSWLDPLTVESLIQTYRSGDGDPLKRAITSTPGGGMRKILGTSTKVRWGEKIGVYTVVAYLSPAREAGVNMCPFSAGCAAVCLGHSTGHLSYPYNRQCRIAKTLYWHLFRADFLAQLNAEIALHAVKARIKGMIPAVRLNGSSDVLWERFGVPQAHPGIRFYDYTKIPGRAVPSNYHLTFSIDEQPDSIQRSRHYLDSGGSAAVVVQSEDGTSRKSAKAAAAYVISNGFPLLPNYPTTSGDDSDVRFRDAGSVVVLYAKGPATRDRSGFVQRLAVLN